MTEIVFTGYANEKRVFFVDKVALLDIRPIEQFEEFKREDYWVKINMLQNFDFQYNKENKQFYIDFNDEDAMEKQTNELVELTEWKSKEEAKAIMWEHYKTYVKRYEFVILVGADRKNLSDMVEEFIAKM